MAEVPNLAGVATQDLVETIGAGNYKASYINWARTMNLLHEHAPGWAPEVHRAPGAGGMLMIRFVHTDGSVRPAYPQSIMDYKNNSIPMDKITSRDITDTHRRGCCMAAAFEFGLAHELWAKMPLESGYANDDTSNAVQSVKVNPNQATIKTEATMKDFLEAAMDKGLTTFAADSLLDKIGTNYAGGIKTLASKTAEWVAMMNKQAEQPTEATAAPPAPVKKKATRPSPEDY